ncbi:MAG: hypothetical protein FWG45_04915 [Oscillospiraceae bacterium]|nr:hypothetical protein [Oscillospiraceae bacterium]
MNSMNSMNTDEYQQMLLQITPRYCALKLCVSDCTVALPTPLKHVERVLISAATLGEEFDRLLRRLQVTNMAGAVILDGMAGAYLEAFHNERDKAAGGQGMRYSPGYGDYPLHVSRDIIAVLDASKRIGLCITEHDVLTPQKSITGVTLI